MNIERPSATVVLPYIRELSEPIQRILAPLHIRTCFRPCRTLSNILVHPKHPVPPDQRKGVVYRISCADCDMTYVGQTGRTLQVRRKEHVRALTNADPQLWLNMTGPPAWNKAEVWIPTHIWTKDVHKRHGIFVPSPTLWTESLVWYLKCITYCPTFSYIWLCCLTSPFLSLSLLFTPPELLYF